MYCDKIKQQIVIKQELVKDVNKKLINEKLKWNYPEIKLLESKELLLCSEIRQLENIHMTIKNNCPFDSSYIKITCDSFCKTYWEFLVVNGKILEIKSDVKSEVKL
jgi:hypothetical protein